MGMYNEVSHECPRCKANGVISYGEGQISQIGDGFGGYCLSDLGSLKRKLEENDITPDQLKRIASCSTDAWFRCEHDGGEHNFKADPAVILAIAMLADRFVVVRTDDTVSRATELLRDLYPD